MATWNSILKRPEFSREKSHRAIVELVELFRRRGAKRILDLGCGAGRHLLYLSLLGFEVYGTDISKVGLKESRKRLKDAELEAELIKCDMTAIPYSDSLFDAVVSVWVIYHSTLEEMQKTISEVHRVLKKNGLAFLTFQSKRSHKFGKGNKIEKDTFILEEIPEKGIPHHFSDKREVQGMLKNFRILSLNLDEFFNKKGKLHSHWEALAEK